jgi:hypothetical protein
VTPEIGWWRLFDDAITAHYSGSQYQTICQYACNSEFTLKLFLSTSPVLESLVELPTQQAKRQHWQTALTRGGFLVGQASVSS